MKFLLVLGLFLAQQTVFAGGSLSQSTRFLLKSGHIFELELMHAGKPVAGRYRKFLDTRNRLLALSKINSSPALIEEAQNLVEATHGADKVVHLNSLLGLVSTADSLGIELNLSTAPVVMAAMFGKNMQTLTTE